METLTLPHMEVTTAGSYAQAVSFCLVWWQLHISQSVTEDPSLMKDLVITVTRPHNVCTFSSEWQEGKAWNWRHGFPSVPWRICLLLIHTTVEAQRPAKTRSSFNPGRTISQLHRGRQQAAADHHPPVWRWAEIEWLEHQTSDGELHNMLSFSEKHCHRGHRCQMNWWHRLECSRTLCPSRRGSCRTFSPWNPLSVVIDNLPHNETSRRLRMKIQGRNCFKWNCVSYN